MDDIWPLLARETLGGKAKHWHRARHWQGWVWRRLVARMRERIVPEQSWSCSGQRALEAWVESWDKAIDALCMVTGFLYWGYNPIMYHMQFQCSLLPPDYFSLFIGESLALGMSDALDMDYGMGIVHELLGVAWPMRTMGLGGPCTCYVGAWSETWEQACVLWHSYGAWSFTRKAMTQACSCEVCLWTTMPMLGYLGLTLTMVMAQ